MRPCKQLRAGVLEIGRGNTPLRKNITDDSRKSEHTRAQPEPSLRRFSAALPPADAAVQPTLRGVLGDPVPRTGRILHRLLSLRDRTAVENNTTGPAATVYTTVGNHHA